MKKRNLLIIGLLMSYVAMAQVWVDSAGTTSGLVDKGASFAITTGKYTYIRVDAGGNLTALAGKVDTLICNGGSIKQTGNLELYKLFLLNTGNYDNDAKEVNLYSNLYVYIGENMNFQRTPNFNAGTFRFRGSNITIENNKANFSLQEMRVQYTPTQLVLKGTEPITTKNIENAANFELTLENNLVITGIFKVKLDYDFKINLNGYKLSTLKPTYYLNGANINKLLFNGEGYIEWKGITISDKLTLPQLKDLNNNITPLTITTPADMTFGTAPSIEMDINYNKISNVANGYLNKYIGVTFNNVTSTGSGINMNMGYAAADIVGDSLFPAFLNDAGIWSYASDSIQGDSVYYTGITEDGIFTARNPIEIANAQLSSVSTLHQKSLNGDTITIELGDVFFADGTLVPSNFVLNAAPTGVSISAVNYYSPIEADVILAYDNTDFNADSTITITIKGAELTSATDLESSNITIVASDIDASLSNLSISDGVLVPTFSSDVVTYYDTVTVNAVSITPTATSSTTSIHVNGELVVSGNPSSSIALTAGAVTVITIADTAENTNFTKTYTINVYKKSTDANLSALSVDQGTLSPSFDANTTAYVDTVENSVSNITLTPTVNHSNATVTVNAADASTPVSLNVGNNTITVTVTAESGNTKDYTVTVYKKDVSTGITDNKSENIAIYPNPSKGTIYIDAPSISNISIVALNGITLLNENVNGNTAKIDVSAIENGAYILVVNSNNKTITQIISIAK